MRVKVDDVVYSEIKNLSFAPQVNISGFELPINELSVEVTADVGYGKFIYLQSDKGKDWCKFWIIRTEDIGDGYYRVYAQDILALLDRVELPAKVYSQTSTETAVAEVFSAVQTAFADPLYEIDTNSSVNGYAPKQTARERLQWICFTSGLTVRTAFAYDNNNKIIPCTIKPIDTAATNIDNVYYKPIANREDEVKSVSVMSYSFTEGVPGETDEWVRDETNDKIYIVEASRYTAYNPNYSSDDVPKDVAVDDCMMITGTATSILARMGGYYFNDYRTVQADILETNMENLSCVPGDRIVIDIGGELICGYIEESSFTFGKACKQSVKISRMNEAVASTTITVVVEREEEAEKIESEEYDEWVVDGSTTVRDYKDGNIVVITDGVETPITDYQYVTEDDKKIYDIDVGTVIVKSGDSDGVINVIRVVDDVVPDIDWGFPEGTSFSATLPIITKEAYKNGSLAFMYVYVPIADEITGNAGDSLSAYYFLAYTADYESGVAKVWGASHSYKYSDVNVVITDKTISKSGIVLSDLMQDELKFPLSSDQAIWIMRGSPKIHLRLEDIDITENGEYLPEILGFRTVNINVPIQLGSKSISVNGSYSADGEGWASVSVNVEKNNKLQALMVTQAGHYTPPQGYIGFSGVDVNIPNASDYKFVCGEQLNKRFSDIVYTVGDNLYRYSFYFTTSSPDSRKCIYYINESQRRVEDYPADTAYLTATQWGLWSVEVNGENKIACREDYEENAYLALYNANSFFRIGVTTHQRVLLPSLTLDGAFWVCSFKGNIHLFNGKEHYRRSAADFYNSQWVKLEDMPIFLNGSSRFWQAATYGDKIYMLNKTIDTSQTEPRYTINLQEYTEEQTQQGETRNFKKVCDLPIEYLSDYDYTKYAMEAQIFSTDMGIMVLCNSYYNYLEEKAFLDSLGVTFLYQLPYLYRLVGNRLEKTSALLPPNSNGDMTVLNAISLVNSLHSEPYRFIVSWKGKAYICNALSLLNSDLFNYNRTDGKFGMYEIKKLELKE